MEKFWTILAVFNCIMLVLCVIAGAPGDAFTAFLIDTFGCAIIAEIEINSKKEE